MSTPESHVSAARTSSSASSASSADSTAEDDSLRPQWKALAALCIGFFMILLDQTIVAVATPQLYEQLDATLTQVVWVTSAYLLCYAVPLLVTGRLGDRFGQRQVYILGMLVFTVSSLVCGLSSSIHVLIVARGVQGLGAAILTPQTMSVINRIFPQHRRGAAMGVWGAVAGLANLAGPLLGGIIVAHYGWQWIFFINVPIGVVSIILVWAWVPRLERVARRLDTASVVISVVWVFALVFAVQQGPELNFGPVVWALLALAAVGIVLFVYQQRRVDERGLDPLVPLRIFRSRNFSIGVFSIATMGFCVNSMMLPFMVYVQADHGLSAQQAGYLLIPMAVAAFCLAPFAGKLSDRVHPRVMSMIGFGGCTVTVAWMALFMSIDASPAWMMLPVGVFGVTSAFVWSPNAVATMRELSPELTGAGSGIYNTTRQLGSVLGAAAVGAVLAMSVPLAMAIPAVALLAGFFSVMGYTFPDNQHSGSRQH